jgi:ParB-like chromosome segregation protein Spo0J
MDKIRPELLPLAVDIATIVPNPHNPNMGDVDEIRMSLRRFGQFRPVTVDRRTGWLVTGHHTYAAAYEEGWDRIAVSYVTTVDDAEATAMMLADNGTARRGGDDPGLLLRALESLPDLSGTGYTPAQLGRLAAAVEVPLSFPDPPAAGACVLCGRVPDTH